MGSVIKRTRLHKDGRKVDYWYISYSINGKRKWEAVGEVDQVNKTMAKVMKYWQGE